MSDATQNGTLNYQQQGGNVWYVGADLEFGPAARFLVSSVDYLAAGKPLDVLQPTSVAFSVAAGGSNVSLVTITVKDAAGNAVTGPVDLDITLSDAATGAGLTATTASGAVAAGASGVDLATLVSKKALRVQTTAAGVYILSITDSAKTGFYVTAALGGKKAFVSSQLVTGNYG